MKGKRNPNKFVSDGTFRRNDKYLPLDFDINGRKAL